MDLSILNLASALAAHASARQEVLAENVAHADTPGYRARDVADFAAIVHDTPRADPARPVRLPGEIEMESLARHRRDGLDIEPALRATLEAFAARRA